MNTNICLYIEGTKKVYKVFDSEQEANEFLHLWESYVSTPRLELGECTPHTRRLWSYPIHWEIINGIHLNNFEAYEHLLFMEDERELPDRWQKFIKYDTHGDIAGVYMPFNKPEHGKEFHLNHYVYWMVLDYLGVHHKITEFFDYNTDEDMKPPVNWCWACEYDTIVCSIYNKRYANGDSCIDCEKCPIWRTMYGCENDFDSPYKLWIDDLDDCADEIATMPWTLFDDEINNNFNID